MIRMVFRFWPFFLIKLPFRVVLFIVRMPAFMAQWVIASLLRWRSPAFWVTASIGEIEAALDKEINVNLKYRGSSTPLRVAAGANTELAVIALLLGVAAVFVACGSEPAPAPTAATGDPTARAVAAEPTPMPTATSRPTEPMDTPAPTPTPIVKAGYCGRLCDPGFWFDASLRDVIAELDGGSDIMAKDDNGWTPLHGAARANAEPAVIALLLDRGADIAARSDVGRTPLHWSAETKTEPAVIALLLDRGADIAARDDDGQTACQFAELMNRETDIRRLLCR